MAKLALSAALFAAAAGQHAAEVALPAGLLAKLAAAPQGGPSIAPSFSADIVTYAVSTLGASKGTFQYDRAGQRWRITSCAKNTLFHVAGDEICSDQLLRNVSGQQYGMNMTAGKGDDAVCKVFPNPYYDMFSVLALGQKIGADVVGGVACDVWKASYVHDNVNITASGCVGADGVPRSYNFSSGMAFKAMSEQHYLFSNAVPGPQPDSAFEPTEVCATRYPMPACPSNGTITLDLYRVHSSAEPKSLANRNLGDALGDMAFFCDLAGFDDTQVVTRWTVQAESAWGQYAYCLFRGGKNLCWGHTGTHVGRESALGVGPGPAQGQCTKNDDVGTWYSFPGDGECPQGSPVGTGGCTWTATPARTVSAACVLKDRGLEQMCNIERGHAPMIQSAAIFEAALATADPSIGGCPDVTDAVLVV